MKKNYLTVVAAILVITLLLTACGTQPTVQNGAVGTILLSVNPEIEIGYDRQGLVVEVEGVNEDGRDILLHYTDYEGKTCAQVTSELVQLIYDAGCFQLELDGNPKNIVVKLEEGSAYPNDAFLTEVADSVRTVVNNQGGKSDTMVVDRKDLNEKGLIGLEKAKELVLAQLNLEEASFTDKEYELDDGVYELEFTENGVEYEYDVDAKTGKILKSEKEKDDKDDKDDVNIPAAITLEDAKKAVFAKLGITEAQAERLRTEYDEGKYEIDFYIGTTEYEFEVDGQTGNILKSEQDQDGKDDVNIPAAITLEDAKKTVFDKVGITEAQAERLRTEYDEGKYEIDFYVGTTEYEFDVDGQTGKILKQEIDKNDRDDDRYDDDDDDDDDRYDRDDDDDNDDDDDDRDDD